MSKQYDDKLVQALKQRQKVENYHGAPVLVKNLPDSDEKGAMDPRLYRDQNTVSTGQCIYSEHPQRRHAVDDNIFVVIFRFEVFYNTPEHDFPTHSINQIDLKS